MKLTIKYFASIREQIGLAQETVDINASHITIADVREMLISRSLKTGEALDTTRPVRVAVNHEMVTTTFVVRQDSEIAFFPPVTGG